MLIGSLRAMNKVGLKLNVSKENLGKVMSLLPSLKAPTVSGLYSEEWFAVDSVIDTGVVPVSYTHLTLPTNREV